MMYTLLDGAGLKIYQSRLVENGLTVDVMESIPQLELTQMLTTLVGMSAEDARRLHQSLRSGESAAVAWEHACALTRPSPHGRE